MPKGYGFPVASKILHRGDQDRAMRVHRQKVNDMRAGLDNSPPRRHPHLVLRLKQTQMEEEYLANVDYENKMLLQKMMRIMEKPRNGMDNWNNYEAKSLNQPFKTRESKRIEQENLAIARRLEAVRPIYNTEKWEEDHKRHKYYLDLWAEDRGSHGRSKDGSVSGSKGDDQYEDDFEDDEDDDGDRKTERLPTIKQEKDNKGRRRSKSESSVQRLPKIQSRKHDPRLHMYWGRYFNADPEVEEEDGKPSQAETDAQQLFRVAKALAPPHGIIIRTLIRRTAKQREMIKNKFNELYELDIATELKIGLGKDWHLLIDALLPVSSAGDSNSRDSKDKDKDDGGQGGADDEPEDALHNALEKGDILPAVKLISSRTEKQLAGLKERYKKKYGMTVEAQVEAKTQDPVQLFLRTLLRDKQASDSKQEGVQQEATAIYEQGDGRWSSPSGEFMRLLKIRNNSHMRAVLKKYEQVSGGTTASKAIEQECSKSYADAVAAFLNSEAGSGKGGDTDNGGSSDGTACAVVMYKNLNPQNSTFVNVLVERSEVDMPAVRRAYKKKYKSELHTDLEDRSRHTTVSCLVELILKVPPAQCKGKDQGNQGQKKGHNKAEDQQLGKKKSPDKRSQDEDHGRGQGQSRGPGQEQGQKQGHDQGQSNKKGNAEKREDGKQKKKKKDGGAEAKAAEDAEKLHQAMVGYGRTDEDTVLDIIIKRSNAQRQTLKKKYKEKYKKELADDLKSELTGDFEEVILGLLMRPVEYDAFCLNKAVKGLGTNEAVLIGILCTANPKELSVLKDQYKQSYGEDLESALTGDTSGGFRLLLLGLARGDRDQGTSVNDKEAKEDALKLSKDKKLDIRSETFQELMTKKNTEQMKATFAEYKKLSGKSMEEAIKAACSGDEEDAYMALLSAKDDPVTFYADSLQQAFKGMGTNDDQLIRIIISRSEVDLPAIKAMFQKRHERALRAAIEDETSGDYRKALVRLVDKK